MHKFQIYKKYGRPSSKLKGTVVVFQLLSHDQPFVTQWTAVHEAPVLHYLTEFAQTHVHSVGHAIQPPHPVALLFSCPQSSLESGSFPMRQLFTSGGQSTGASASVLPMKIQGWFSSGLTISFSLQSKALSRASPSTTIRKYQFFGDQPSLWSNYHTGTWLPEKSLTIGLLSAKWCLCF